MAGSSGIRRDGIIQQCLRVLLGSQFERDVADCGLRDTLRCYCKRLLFSPRTLYFRLHECYEIFVSETRSLFGRISIRRKRMNCVSIGPTWERLSTGHLVECTRTLVRSADIREMLSNRPWASLGDLQVFLEGWDRGERYSLDHTSGSYSPQSESNNSRS